MVEWNEKLDQLIDQDFAETVKLRRHLHMHPEPSGSELETSLHLYQRLEQKGFQVRLGPEGCGVIADLDGSDSGKPEGMFAFRADIDALPIQDEKQTAYRSRCDGVMHACGHDGHTATVVAAITAIARMHQSGQLPFQPRLRGIFQPAEETCRGAAAMIRAGALEGVDAVIATHMDPSRRVGQIGVRVGVLTANCDLITIVVEGRGGHAARPHEARDPIAAAAQLIQSMYMQLPRETDSQDSVVVTFGMIQGGENANVIPERVELQGTMRTLNARVRQRTMETIERLAGAIAMGTKTKIHVQYGVGAAAVENDRELVELIRKAAEMTPGIDAVQSIRRPSMGSEDFSFYCSHVPVAMFRLGCCSDTVGGSGLHTPMFDIDEQSIRLGAAIMARSALAWMRSRQHLGQGSG